MQAGDKMYLVIEIQTQDNGLVSTLTYSFDNKKEALSKYHSILSAAAVSGLPKHGAAILRNDCFMICGYCFKANSSESDEEE